MSGAVILADRHPDIWELDTTMPGIQHDTGGAHFVPAVSVSICMQMLLFHKESTNLSCSKKCDVCGQGVGGCGVGLAVG